MTSDNQFDGSLKVSSIQEEYMHVGGERCECGGKYTPLSQALIYNEEGNPFDLLNCKCMACEKEEKFYFDISSFFGHNNF